VKGRRQQTFRKRHGPIASRTLSPDEPVATHSAKWPPNVEQRAVIPRMVANQQACSSHIIIHVQVRLATEGQRANPMPIRRGSGGLPRRSPERRSAMYCTVQYRTVQYFCLRMSVTWHRALGLQLASFTCFVRDVPLPTRVPPSVT